MNGIQRNLTGRSERPLPSLSFSDRSENKTAALASDWLKPFDFCSEIAKRNSTKFDKKQYLNVLSQVYVFRVDRRNNMAARPLIGWDISDFSFETAERNTAKLKRKQDLNVLYLIGVFRAYRKTKKVALVSGCLRHFRLFLWNSWSEFNETWQEVRSQGPLPNLCLSDRSKNQVGRSCRLSTKVIITLYSVTRYVALWVPCSKFISCNCTLL